MTPPLKWHGGKHYLAPKLWDLCSPILDSVVYCVEPYAGGASWTLEGIGRGYEKSFCINDCNLILMNFWGILAKEGAFQIFQREIEAAPFSQALWETAHELIDHFKICPCFTGTEAKAIQGAVAFFITCRQSLAGRMKAFSPLSKSRTRRGMNEQVSAWWNAVDGLDEVHEALKRVALLCDEATKVIFAEDSPTTLFYCDPPYLRYTRSGKDKSSDYQHEMTEDDHGKLLEELAGIKGKFLLSGYHSDLYECHALKHGWKLHQFELPNNAAGGAEKQRMTECVWTNF